MKTEFMYSDDLRLSVYDIDEYCWEWGHKIENLDEALALAKTIFDGDTIFTPEMIDQIFITSGNTGEIIAVCRPDYHEENEIDNPNWTPEEVEWGLPWDYENEDDEICETETFHCLEEIANEICELFF